MATPPPGANFEAVHRWRRGNGHDGDMPMDQLWLNSYPLVRNIVFDYFALSPFYDWTCNNEQLRMRSIHPLDISQLFYHQPLHLHYFLKVILQQQPEKLRMALKPNKQGSRDLLLSIQSSIKVQLKE
ncbi:hypothetical protein LWI29_032744 [Acer saccharum]|uniref:Mediator of RNA polymerase II transcription subunit 6 n=1 Tax=Acer saccharum TaxID=4024 RepID=A0AA39SHJ1_ACESA|nr:hypothetical protein LWI29_032744 [Acer saccharum]